MPPDMLERVAKAIWNDSYPEDEWNEIDRRDYLGHARAAIEAMREPTKWMTRAAVRYGDSAGYEHISEWDAKIVWEAMIDAALAEERK